MLKDAQKQVGLYGRTISDETLLLFASTPMLPTERNPRAYKDWEDQAEEQKTWNNWKTSYKKSHTKARVKAQAAKGTDKFGAANAAEQVFKNIDLTTEDCRDNVGLKALEVYFGNLSAAATNKETFMDQLVANNVKLVVANEELVGVVKKYPTKI